MTNAKRPGIFFLILFAAAVLGGCASTGERLVGVQRGMTPQQVHREMGAPKDKTFRGNQELWTYDGDGGQGKVVVFDHGKVVDLLNTDASKPGHSVASTDVNTADNRSDVCSGQNNYGKFAEGGGCNLYGCYPAGGFCNGFGCTSTGICTVNGCPNKIESFRCRD